MFPISHIVSKPGLVLRSEAKIPSSWSVFSVEKNNKPWTKPRTLQERGLQSSTCNVPSLRARDDGGGALTLLLGEHLAPLAAMAAMAAHVAVVEMSALEELVLQLVEVVVPLQVAEAAALTLHH